MSNKFEPFPLPVVREDLTEPTRFVSPNEIVREQGKDSFSWSEGVDAYLDTLTGVVKKDPWALNIHNILPSKIKDRIESTNAWNVFKEKYYNDLSEKITRIGRTKGYIKKWDLMLAAIKELIQSEIFGFGDSIAPTFAEYTTSDKEIARNLVPLVFSDTVISSYWKIYKTRKSNEYLGKEYMNSERVADLHIVVLQNPELKQWQKKVLQGSDRETFFHLVLQEIFESKAFVDFFDEMSTLETLSAKDGEYKKVTTEIKTFRELFGSEREAEFILASINADRKIK